MVKGQMLHRLDQELHRLCIIILVKVLCFVIIANNNKIYFEVRCIITILKSSPSFGSSIAITILY